MSDDDSVVLAKLHGLKSRRAKLRELERLKNIKNSLREQLPHLYGYPWYAWAKRFFDSTNHMNLICAANQISKSSTQIRKCIDWATNPDKWPTLWRNTPRQFWYIYPSQEVATIEFDKKWVPEFMPRGPMKDDPIYGWQEQRDRKSGQDSIRKVDFNSGVSIIFKFHSQKVSNLQTATVDAVFADEELPESMYDEIQFRLAATRGYFHMVFTATLGQELWRRAIQPANKDDEMFHAAFKQRVGMYDCLAYENSTIPTPWTKELIEQEVIPKCKNEAEVRRRVFGEFVVDSGKSYYGFDPERNVGSSIVRPRPEWQVYAGVDPGSGGQNHPASIVFVGVELGNRKAYVFRAWRGDGIETTAGDVFEKYQALSRDLSVVDRRYDFASKDFATLAERAGVTFNKADKSRVLGEDLLNTLFRNQMLVIGGNDPELGKLISELMTLQKKTDKTKAKDDLIDALRYCIMGIPWDWEALNSVPEKAEEERVLKPLTDREILEEEIKQRRGRFESKRQEDVSQLAWADEIDEIDYWNSEYGGG